VYNLKELTKSSQWQLFWTVGKLSMPSTDYLPSFRPPVGQYKIAVNNVYRAMLSYSNRSCLVQIHPAAKTKAKEKKCACIRYHLPTYADNPTISVGRIQKY
jgi:hypothetical protein